MNKLKDEKTSNAAEDKTATRNRTRRATANEKNKTEMVYSCGEK